MSKVILSRLPKFDDELSEEGAEDMSFAAPDLGDLELNAGPGQPNGPDKVVGEDGPTLPVCKQELNPVDISKLTMALCTGLEGLRCDSRSYIETQLAQIASHLFPQMAKTLFGSELLAQLGQLGGRLPETLTMYVSPELAQYLDGRLDAALGSDISVTVETKPSLEFYDVHLCWGTGGANYNFNTALQEILKVHVAPAASQGVQHD